LWALNAKNSLKNCYGFSTLQLHIGKNPLLPSTTRDGPPAYENARKCKNFAAHINAMHSARAEFIKAESSSALKKELKGKVHPRGHDIVPGDKIYFKQNKAGKIDVVWQGPSKVVATNGKKLFVDKGARLGTVNRDDAVRQGEELWKLSDEEHTLNDQEIENRIAEVLKKVHLAERAKTYSSSSQSESESEEEEEEEEEESEYESAGTCGEESNDVEELTSEEEEQVIE
jgi:hypothetical protein